MRPTEMNTVHRLLRQINKTEPWYEKTLIFITWFGGISGLPKLYNKSIL